MKTTTILVLSVLALIACNDAKAPANDSGDGAVVETASEAGAKPAAAPAASAPMAPDSKPAAAPAPAASAAPAAPADAGAAPKASATPAKPAASAAPKK
jgi:hypothetical protein